MKFLDRCKTTIVYLSQQVKHFLHKSAKKCTPQSIQDTVQIVKPFFSQQKLKATVITGSYLSLSLLDLYSIKYFSNQEKQYSTENEHYLNLVLSSFIFYTVTARMKGYLNGYFRQELEAHLQTVFTEKTHTKRHSLIGIEFLQNEIAKENAAYEPIMLAPIFYQHISNFTDGFVDIISVCSSIPSTGTNLFYLFNAAPDRTLYLIGASFFSVMAFLNSTLSPTFERMHKEHGDIIQKLYSRVYHNQENQTQICALRAHAYEQEVLHTQHRMKNQIITRLRYYKSLIQLLNDMISTTIPIIIEFWDPSRHSIIRVRLRQQTGAIVSFFMGFLNLYTTALPSMNASKKIILKFQGFLNQSDILFSNTVKREFNPASPVLEIQDLTLDIPGEPNVVTKANAQFKTGTIWKLIGDSGVGKSTILKALSGFWPKATGLIRFPCQENEIAYTTQTPMLPPHTTLLDAIRYPSLQSTEAEIQELMNCLGLEKLIDSLHQTKSWGYTLSGGQLKRVILIKAILQKAKVVLLDEPAAGLDPTNCRKLYDTLKKRLPNATIIYIEHESTDVEKSIEANIEYLTTLRAKATDGNVQTNLDAQIVHYKEKLRTLRDDSFCDGYIQIVGNKFVLTSRKTNLSVHPNAERKEVAEAATEAAEGKAAKAIATATAATESNASARTTPMPMLSAFNQQRAAASAAGFAHVDPAATQPQQPSKPPNLNRRKRRKGK